MKTTPCTFEPGHVVTVPGFVDCFGCWCPEITDLVVERVSLVECDYMPDYWRIKAVRAPWATHDTASYEGAARFFAHAWDSGAGRWARVDASEGRAR